MGFSPLAPARAYIGAADQGVVALGTQQTPTIVRAGVGMLARVDIAAGELLLDSAAAQPARDYHHFHPGALTAPLTLAELADSRIGAEAVLQYIEANFLVAPPTGTDAANHYALTIAGSVSGGPATLAFNVAGQRRFNFDLQAPIYHAIGNPKNLNIPRGAFALPLQYTADVRIEAIELSANNGAADSPAGRRRITITDKLGQPLVYTETEYAYPDGTFIVPLPYALDLPAWTDSQWGSSGFIVIEPIDAVETSLRGFMSLSTVRGDAAGEGFYPPFSEITLTGYLDGARWTDGRTFPESTRKYTAGEHFFASNGSRYQATLGRTVGVPIKGDIVANLVLTGAPGGAPENMNLRIETSPQLFGA